MFDIFKDIVVGENGSISTDKVVGKIGDADADEVELFKDLALSLGNLPLFAELVFIEEGLKCVLFKKGVKNDKL